MTVFIILFECLVILFFGYLAILLLYKPQYERRELVCSCDLLPVFDDVYAIKTCKNKYLCRYIDFEDENKIKIDVLSIETNIAEMPEGTKPVFYLYEMKAKNPWIHIGCGAKYVGLLCIPKGSVMEE